MSRTRETRRVRCGRGEPSDSPWSTTCQMNQAYQRRRPIGDKSDHSTTRSRQIRRQGKQQQQQQQQVVPIASDAIHTRQGNMVNNYRVIKISSLVIVNFAATLFLLHTSTTMSATAASSALSSRQQHRFDGNNRHQHQAARTASPLILNDSAAAGDTSKDEHSITNTNQLAGSLISANHSDESSALSYLQRYGYMSAQAKGWDTINNNLISEESFTKAVYDFQRFAGLPQTGQVDNETLSLMQLPRCGNADKPVDNHHGHNLFANQKSIAQGVNHHPNRTVLRRKRRYALQGSKWRRQELTYRISQYPTRFISRRHEVDAQIHKAFSIWSQVAPIDFVPKREGRVHIDIRFASGDHGDGDAFDGPGNTLAHAYFPQYGGDAHFDDQEYWTIDSYTGTNIFQVAAHELGHSLGLGHSNVRGALMAPFYQKYKPNFKLHVDDILAIQALYGEKPVAGGGTSPNDVATGDDADQQRRPLFPLPGAMPTTTTTTSTTSTTTTTAAPPSDASGSRAGRYPVYTGFGRGTHRPSFFGGGSDPTTTTTTVYREPNDNELDPNVNSIGRGDSGEPGDGFPADLCSDPSIDAVTRTEDGSTYVFKGDYYWHLVQDGIAKGYPRKISTDWEGLPGNVDAALTWVDGKTFFFKGNKYWRFRNRRRDVGYPKLIKVGFAGIPDNIDAAFVWSGNGRTYIFKGAEYWRFDSKSDPPVSSEYPRSIKVWSGVPANVDAAFKWENNITYFFKDKQYYRFNDRDFKVEERGRPPFPRNTANWWFGCASSNLAAQRSSEPSNNHFREAEPVSPVSSHHQDGSSSQQQNDGEWSFLAGLETNTHELGTHINDRKPTITSSSPRTFDERHDAANNQADDDRPEQWIPQPDQPSLISRADNDDHMNPPVVTSRRSQSGFRLSPGNNPGFTSNVPSTQSSASSSLHRLSSSWSIKTMSWLKLHYACVSLISSYLLAIQQAPQTRRSFRDYGHHHILFN